MAAATKGGGPGGVICTHTTETGTRWAGRACPSQQGDTHAPAGTVSKHTAWQGDTLGSVLPAAGTFSPTHTQGERTHRTAGTRPGRAALPIAPTTTGGMRHWGAQVQCSNWGWVGAGGPPTRQAASCLPRGARKVSPQQAQRTEGQEQLHPPSPVLTLAPPAAHPHARNPTDPHCQPHTTEGLGCTPSGSTPGVIPHTRSGRLQHPHAHPVPRDGPFPPSPPLL